MDYANRINIMGEVVNADCMSVMRSLPDNYFDWAVVDPPYRIYGNSHRKNMSRNKATLATEYHNELWNQSMPSQEYFDELFRVSKDQIIFGINYFVGRNVLKIGGVGLYGTKLTGTVISAMAK